MAKLTEKELIALKEQKAEERRKLTLFTSPIQTLRHFSIVAFSTISNYTHWVVTHRAFLFFGVPLALLWIIASNIDGNHQVFLNEVQQWAKFVVWWLGLGILSSVGLGTGMHTGILFLFPHILKVCLAASACKTLDFDSRSDMWFSQNENTFTCPAIIPTEDTVTFWGIFFKVFLPCFIWGTGTAMGEIPPYAVSRAARLAGQANEEFEEITEAKSSWDILNRMKLWMIDFLQKHGFIGVLLMAAWPNMAFDLCGICCGHFLMPFWQFFGATFIGKALIKVNLQSMFFIMLFSKEYLSKFLAFVDALFPPNWDPCSLFSGKECHVLLEALLNKAKQDFSKQVSGEHQVSEDSIVKKLWGFVMVAFIAYFVKSCIEQFAQQRAAEIDHAELQRLAEESGLKLQEKKKN